MGVFRGGFMRFFNVFGWRWIPFSFPLSDELPSFPTASPKAFCLRIKSGQFPPPVGRVSAVVASWIGRPPEGFPPDDVPIVVFAFLIYFTRAPPRFLLTVLRASLGTLASFPSSPNCSSSYSTSSAENKSSVIYTALSGSSHANRLNSIIV